VREAPNDVVVLNVMAEGSRERPTVDEARQWRSLYQLLFTVVADVDGAWVEDWGEGLNWRSHAVLDMDGKVVYHTNEDHVGILEEMKRVIRATPGPE
jgi:hypothetical protein